MSVKALFKSDKYRKSRGGHSRWLHLYCEKCCASIAIYQKDGPGILKRLYIDRISAPEKLVNACNEKLVCSSCRTVLGVRYIYDKEKRLAYRLFAGAINKNIVKAGNLAKVKF